MTKPKNPHFSFTCTCGRVWQIEKQAPSGRTENLACRCGYWFASSEDGALDAELLTPREGCAVARKALYTVGLVLLMIASRLRVTLAMNSWLRPHRLARLARTNRPVRFRWTFTTKAM